MKANSILISLLVVLSLFIINTCSADSPPGKSNVDNKNKQIIEQVLNSYLSCRRNLDFNCCANFLSKSYLTKFSEENGVPYTEFYKATETYYHEAKIIRINMANDIIQAIVESYSEEPGVMSLDTENYRLKNIDGEWRIDGFSIDDSKIVKEIGADGKWKDIKH